MKGFALAILLGGLAFAQKVQPPEPQADLRPSKTLQLNSSIGGLLSSIDGKRLFVLDMSATKLLVVDTDSLEVAKEIPLQGGEAELSMSSDGKTLVAGGDHSLSVIDAIALTSKGFKLDKPIVDLWVKDSDTLYVTSRMELLRVSIQGQAVIGTERAYGEYLHGCGDGKRVYGSGLTLLFIDPKGPPVRSAENPLDSALHAEVQDLSFSPDDRYAVSYSGVVVRLGKCSPYDRVAFCRVEPNTASVFLPQAQRLLVFTQEGFIKVHEMATFELEKSHALGLGVYAAVADESKAAMYLFAGKAPAEQHVAPAPGQPPRLATPVGSLYRFEIPK